MQKRNSKKKQIAKKKKRAKAKWAELMTSHGVTSRKKKTCGNSVIGQAHKPSKGVRRGVRTDQVGV
jgi:hypothetical protein